jgi:hypothetical protein
MDKSAAKAAIMSAVSEELDVWFDKIDTFEDGHEYETEFSKFAHGVNRIMLQESLGKPPSNRNKKKKFSPVLGSLK